MLLAASGATFSAVVVGQMANAFACRSNTRWVARSGWRGNRLLVAAVLAEAGVTGAFLYIPSIAAVLGHAPPVAAGWTVALLTGPAVIAADLIDKTLRNRA